MLNLLQSRTHRVDPRRQRCEGSQLLELMIALAVLALGAMGFLVASQANFKASRDIGTHDLVSAAFSNAVERLRDCEFDQLYGTYHDVLLPAPTTPFASAGPSIGELVDDQGNPARVLVSFYTDETTLPAEYGPLIDLDGDGALSTTDVSGSYQLLPARLSITFSLAGTIETRNLFIVVGDS